MDLRSPQWLEEPIPYTDSYVSEAGIAQILMSDPEILKGFLTTIGCSLSNRQIRETANNAARWVTDINKCEEEEPLDDNLKQYRMSNQTVLSWLHHHRSARCIFNGKNKFRRQ